ncbi:PKHA1-like protein [Mya arenaria]|uniref:PKHA1-like protein n=1 Tax=Mya arenaria TaxID=6604 RepID=A0ABY7FIL4_MYAAR|nr:PKHA1-like protein [Mya arenaria]
MTKPQSKHIQAKGYIGPGSADLPKTCKTNEPYEVIYLNFVSQVSDARKARPKAGYCFCITHTGDQSFYQAENEEQMNKWIEALNEACKITVHDYEVKTTKLAPPNSRNEVAGGVIITTKPENHDSGAESVEHNLPALSLQCYKSGYAVKQGALRKNWKKRYFVLDSNGFSYYKHDQNFTSYIQEDSVTEHSFLSPVKDGQQSSVTLQRPTSQEPTKPSRSVWLFNI